MCRANPARSTCSAVPIAAFTRQAEAIGASAANSARCTRAQAEARCRLSVRTHTRRRIDERTPLPRDKRPKSPGACSTVYTNPERTRDWISPPSGASWAVSHGQVPGETHGERTRNVSHPAPSPEAASSVSTPDQAARGPQHAIVASLCDTAPASWPDRPEGQSPCAPHAAVTHGRSKAPEDVYRAPPQPQATARRVPTQVDADLVWDPDTC